MKPRHQDDEGAGYKTACLRKSRGLSQAELARCCGLSRQFVNLIEAGRTQPSVQVALQLAEALETTVEELFRHEKTTGGEDGLPVWAVQPELTDGTRIGVARVSRRWVAHAVDTPASLGGGFGEADAVLRRTSKGAWAQAHRSERELENNIVVAGCDPALALLREARVAPGLSGRCLWVNCGSGRALQLLAEGRVHVAGVHYSGSDEGENLRQVEKLDPAGRWRVFRFTRWEQGWMVGAGAEKVFRAAGDLGSGRLRLANREAGSGARHWLDAQLSQLGLSGGLVPGYAEELTSHWACAGALAAGRADVAPGPRAIAQAFGLGFFPAEEVAFDLVVPKAHLEHPRVQALMQSLAGRALRREIESLPGYAAQSAGEWLPRAKA